MILYRVKCSRCGHRVKYGDEHVGLKAKCQKCRLSFRLPSGAADDATSRPVPKPECAAEPPVKEPNAEDVRTSCPHCSAKYEIPPRYIGQTVRCQKCERRFRIDVDYVAVMKDLKRDLFRQLLRAAGATSPAIKGCLMADALTTLARLGDAAAAAAPADPAARDTATSAAFEQATAQVRKVTARRALEGAGQTFEVAVMCLVGGIFLVAIVTVVALASDVLFWGLGLIGIVLTLGGGGGVVYGSIEAVDAVSRRYPALRTASRFLAYSVGIVVLVAALAFAGNAMLGFGQS